MAVPGRTIRKTIASRSQTLVLRQPAGQALAVQGGASSYRKRWRRIGDNDFEHCRPARYRASVAMGSKAPPIQLTRTLAVEWSPKGIRVNSLAPRLVKTEFARELWEDPEPLEKLENRIPSENCLVR